MGEANKKSKWIKAIIIIVAVLMLVSIIPAFVLTFYTYPCPGDDYFYVTDLLKGLEQNGLSALITEPIAFAAERYMNWQGSFISCILFSLDPMVFSLDYYGIAMFAINLFFAFAVFRFSYSICSNYFRVKKYISFFVGALLLFSFYHCVPYFNLFEIVYWYTGAVYYFVPLSCVLLLASLILNLMKRNRAGRKTGGLMVGATLLSLMLAFTNLTTAISIWSGLLMVTVLAMIKKNEAKKQLYIILGMFSVMLLINVLSPGYMVRYDHGIDEGMVTLETTNVFEVLLISFRMGTSNLRSFAFISPVIGGLLIIMPLMVRQIKQAQGGYMNPIILLIATYLVFIAQYAPFIYALGNLQYGRIIAYRFFTAQMFYMINVINLCGLLASKVKLRHWIVVVVKTGVVLVGTFLVYHSFVVRVIPSSHIRTMVETYMDGTIPTYIEEKNARIAVLEDDSIKEVIFEPMTETDVCFNFDYTSWNPDDLLNANLAEYYDKTFVIVREEE